MYRISRANVATNEEKVAKKIANLLTDFTLDLEQVGYHLARSTPHLLFSRSREVLEAAEYQLDTVEQNRVQYKHDRNQ
jgi:hypothetical protein